MRPSRLPLGLRSWARWAMSRPLRRRPRGPGKRPRSRSPSPSPSPRPEAEPEPEPSRGSRARAGAEPRRSRARAGGRARACVPSARLGCGSSAGSRGVAHCRVAGRGHRWRTGAPDDAVPSERDDERSGMGCGCRRRSGRRRPLTPSRSRPKTRTVISPKPPSRRPRSPPRNRKSMRDAPMSHGSIGRTRPRCTRQRGSRPHRRPPRPASPRMSSLRGGRFGRHSVRPSPRWTTSSPRRRQRLSRPCRG